jgi:hypothetical protein
LYTDDAAFIFLNRQDLIDGTRFIVEMFAKFGLKVHVGCKSKKQKSKTEAMHFPTKRLVPEEDKISLTPEILEEEEEGKKTTMKKKKPMYHYLSRPDQIANYDIEGSDDSFVTFYTEFRYLGTLISPDLDDTKDVQARIDSANGMFGYMKPLLCDRKISLAVRIKMYHACVLTILLWGCESWALTKTDRDSLSVFHLRCLRSMAGINWKLVQEQHISNKEVLRQMKVPPTDTLIDLRILRFLTKIGKMPSSRLTRQIIASKANRSPGTTLPKGGLPTTTRKCWVETLRRYELIPARSTAELKDIFSTTRCTREWSTLVEKKLDLKPGTFAPTHH